MALKYETIAKFISKRGGGVYFVKRKVSTGKLSCNCKGWIYNRKCKHIEYVRHNSLLELTDIPTYDEAVVMELGRNMVLKEKWLVSHLKPIKL